MSECFDCGTNLYGGPGSHAYAACRDALKKKLDDALLQVNALRDDVLMVTGMRDSAREAYNRAEAKATELAKIADSANRLVGALQKVAALFAADFDGHDMSCGLGLDHQPRCTCKYEEKKAALDAIPLDILTSTERPNPEPCGEVFDGEQKCLLPKPCRMHTGKRAEGPHFMRCTCTCHVGGDGAATACGCCSYPTASTEAR